MLPSARQRLYAVWRRGKLDTGYTIGTELRLMAGRYGLDLAVTLDPLKHAGERVEKADGVSGRSTQDIPADPAGIISRLARSAGVDPDDPLHLLVLGAVVVFLLLAFAFLKARVEARAKGENKAQPSTPMLRPEPAAARSPLWRRAFDRLFPRLHLALTETGLLVRPTELTPVQHYLRTFAAQMTSLNQYYLPVDALPAAPMGWVAAGPREIHGGAAIRAVRQSIRIVLGDETAGYGTTAQLALVRRASAR